MGVHIKKLRKKKVKSFKNIGKKIKSNQLNHFEDDDDGPCGIYLCPLRALNEGILVCRSPASEEARDSGREGVDESTIEFFELETLPTRLRRPALMSDGARGILDGRASVCLCESVVTV